MLTKTLREKANRNVGLDWDRPQLYTYMLTKTLREKANRNYETIAKCAVTGTWVDEDPSRESE